MRKSAILFALALCVALAGCNQPAPAPGRRTLTGTLQHSKHARDRGTHRTDTHGDKQTATLYIGTKTRGFAEYPMTYEGELPPELLIR